MAVSMVLMACVSAWGDVAIDEANFPDSVFREYVSSNFDTDSDGMLSEEEIARVRSISVTNGGIYSLQGVENFTALTELTCNYQLDRNKYQQECSFNISELWL